MADNQTSTHPEDAACRADAMGACWRRSSGSKLDLSEAAVAAPLTEFVSGCGCRLKPGQYQVGKVLLFLMSWFETAVTAIAFDACWQHCAAC
jgi:hypothetical protein